MKKIIAFAGSTSSTSINKQSVVYATSLLHNAEVDILDMNDYQVRVFSVDEEEKGFPDLIRKLNQKFQSADGFVISLAEHNGSYASAYKNTIDWLSRLERKLFNNKPMLLMAASPGGRGGASVLEAAKSYYPRLGAEIVSTFSLGNFYDNFKDGKISNEEVNATLKEAVSNFESSL
jgi:NAD(P)H-dependent FMN reductase